jgi:isopentenyldiphosphate isomerase
VSFLDRIAECNGADFSRLVPFRVAGARVGWLRPAFAERVLAFTGVFVHEPDGAVALAPALDTPEARTAAVDRALRTLAGEGHFSGWRDEAYPVSTGWGRAPLLLMERAAVPSFGVRAYGLHVNGYVRDGAALRIWVARRSRAKPTYPGLLDNMVAGGQPHGLSLTDNLVKECAEEAAIPVDLARRATPVGAISYAADLAEGIRPDVQFCFDLELPAGFAPRAADGEVEDFMLLPIGEVAARVRDTREFKFNCNLVIIDFLVRHGLIAPDEPDYVAIVEGLHR